jgi:hypothetical protein
MSLALLTPDETAVTNAPVYEVLPDGQIANLLHGFCFPFSAQSNYCIF